LKEARRQNIPIPPKRFMSENATILFKITQKLRMTIRQKSLDTWKNTPDTKSFDEKMMSSLTCLRKVTRIYHYRRAFTRRFKYLISKFQS
jgi:hypothetical protein